MENIQKNFGFDCMRLPMDGENVNIPETKKNGRHLFRSRFQLF